MIKLKISINDITTQAIAKGRNSHLRRAFLVAILVATPMSVLGQQQTACFCLQNPATLMIEHYGCEARTIASRGIERVRCQTSTFDGRVAVDDFSRFSRINDGDGQCVPCYASVRGDVRDDIRGQDNTEDMESEPGDEVDDE